MISTYFLLWGYELEGIQWLLQTGLFCVHQILAVWTVCTEMARWHSHGYHYTRYMLAQQPTTMHMYWQQAFVTLIHSTLCFLSLSVSVCLSVFLSLCVSLCTSVCLSVCVAVCLRVCLSLYLFANSPWYLTYLNWPLVLEHVVQLKLTFYIACIRSKLEAKY